MLSVKGARRKYFYFVFYVLFPTLYIYGADLPILGKVGNFSLIERSGNIITERTLKGKICVFNFIFTRCTTQCPLMSNNLSILQQLIKKYNDVYLISITGDPEFDKKGVLQEYAKRFGASERWFFLTGNQETIYNLSINIFKLGLKKASDEELKEGADIIMHSTKFVLVDGLGRIRGYYDGKEEENIYNLNKDIVALLREKNVFYKFPTLNAILNICSALFLIIGFLFIKTKNIKAHKICMITAFFLSILFFTSYLIYHYNVGSVKFQGQGFMRQMYFIILGSHTILAAITLPLSITTIYLILKSNISQHKKISPFTLSIWLYVNITGVIIYLMLY